MPNIGPAELLVILIVALVVFGPRKLPELGKSLGAGLREFRKSTQGLKEDFEGSMRDTPPGPAPVQTIHAPAQAVAAAPQPAQAAAVTAQPATAQSMSVPPVSVQPAGPQPVTAEAVAAPIPTDRA
ncbi:Sec-independent protein translocase protein TatA [Deinococcus arenae]|uniref:Sec-independent protein translocase protein TatA n=1 Tax=Deinococcus arenae TaxID=1452751 RepID=A0A8H9GX97_9DEIO|nr:twin-arginine translocase TatA/TatE family subunit [Deinococcus arenae]AWT34606.1 twin-arginine translocase TatA/TatE family subunit [Deinococcus actinosclerus]GGM52387.1 Sec-independent protein translocase protein TatA [Deinococcus arenae]